MLPRLPNELPLPARASAKPGDKARARAAQPAIRTEERRMGFRFEVVTRLIWCGGSAKARAKIAGGIGQGGTVARMVFGQIAQRCGGFLTCGDRCVIGPFRR
jgi:hypothetical protein